MDVIADTDVLSTFSKINKLNLLRRLLRKSKIYISPKNRDELLEAKKLGYKFVNRTLKLGLKTVKPNEKELSEIKQLVDAKKSLSSADLETLIIAQDRGLLLLTNDSQLQNEAKRRNVEYFNLVMILRELWRQKIVSKEYVERLVEIIEKEDRIILINKNLIFEE